MRITGILLKKGAAAGLTLHQIGTMLCREDDYEDEEQPSLIEEIVERAQNMAKNRRSFTKFKDHKKIRSLESFKKQRKENRNGLKQNGDKAVAKINSLRQKGTALDKDEELNPQSTIMSIKNGFAAFEDDEDEDEKEEEKQISDFRELHVKKANSHFTDLGGSNFYIGDVSKKMNHRKRDRTQSESDSQLDFSTDRFSSPSKRFKMKSSSEEINEALNRKESDTIQKNGSTSSSYFEEDSSASDSTPEDTHPIKRTLSLPRIKILENKADLPKIKEEEEEEPTSSSKNSTNSAITQPLSLSPESSKLKPLKMLREDSSDMKEKELRHSPYDHYFFYYYETYLEEAIGKITKDITLKSATRGRSRSEV